MKQKLTLSSVHVYMCVFMWGAGEVGLRSGKNSRKACGKVERASRIEYLNYVLAYLPESLETIIVYQYQQEKGTKSRSIKQPESPEGRS